VNEVNEVNEMNEMSEMNDMNEMNEVNDINEVNEMNGKNEWSEQRFFFPACCFMCSCDTDAHVFSTPVVSVGVQKTHDSSPC